MKLFEHEQRHLDSLSPFLSECLLFLKKDDSYPLKKAGTISVYGSGVRHTIKGGSGSGEVNSHFFDNVETALTKNGFTITNPEWLDKYDEIRKKARKNWIKAMKKEAKEHKIIAPLYCLGAVCPEPEYDLEIDESSDSALYVLGRISGEGTDRKAVKGDALLNDSEIRDILLLNKKYKNFLLVINTGGAVDLTPILEVRNILLLSELGVMTSQTLIDTMLGKINPSGKLTATWTSFDQYPYSLDIDENEVKYVEDKYVGYRYFTAKGIRPLFPFGFGLSYSSFKISFVDIKNSHDEFIVKVKVENTSDVTGKEVIQLYLVNDVYNLVAFKKSDYIKPKEVEELELSFKLRDFANYDADREVYYLKKGDYYLHLGNSSVDNECILKIHLDEEIITEKSPRIFDEIKIDTLKIDYKHEDIDIKSISLNQSDIEIIEYKQKEFEVVDSVKELSDLELAYCNCGRFIERGGLSNIIGESSSRVLGGAGETTKLLEVKMGIDLVLADGPAGLRLTNAYYIDKKGRKKEIIKNSIIASLNEFLPSVVRFTLRHTLLRQKKLKEGTKIYYQYCTALPIETAIAQSWNLDFAYLCGDIVGEEMEIYDVDIWLAPALNIHRHVLCGRNYEYYSEDPLISGLFAAYETKGAQRHKHKGVTLKHFAANNQEVNRVQSDSIVSEDALRTIYLKGFKIAVKESNPVSFMTSYNLINGIHTSENVNLINNYLYSECGFDGFVMTDWIIPVSENKYGTKPFALSNNIVKTNTSLVMPGFKEDVNRILEAINNNEISRETIERNVSTLIKAHNKLFEK